MSLGFEWDPKKAEANLATHGVSLEEALTVFADPWRESSWMTNTRCTSSVKLLLVIAPDAN